VHLLVGYFIKVLKILPVLLFCLCKFTQSVDLISNLAGWVSLVLTKQFLYFTINQCRLMHHLSGILWLFWCNRITNTVSVVKKCSMSWLTQDLSSMPLRKSLCCWNRLYSSQIDDGCQSIFTSRSFLQRIRKE